MVPSGSRVTESQIDPEPEIGPGPTDRGPVVVARNGSQAAAIGPIGPIDREPVVAASNGSRVTAIDRVGSIGQEVAAAVSSGSPGIAPGDLEIALVS